MDRLQTINEESMLILFVTHATPPPRAKDTGYIIELAVERLEEVYCGGGGDVGTSD